jgi:hypothetical protein
MYDPKEITLKLTDRDLSKLIHFLHVEASQAAIEMKGSITSISPVTFTRHRILASVGEQLVKNQLGEALYDQIKTER